MLGVAALQSAGFAHRDLKPSNILVGGKDEVWIADLGSVLEIAGTHVGPSLHRFLTERLEPRGSNSSDNVS
ncbi:protein kinase family protein [bacterium]|nr:protein kinase family protein [bacterium]